MINNYPVKNVYNSLCLVSSASCNLSCKYCEIAKSKNHGYNKQLQDNIKKAFEDGSFLENVLKSYKILNQDTSKVEFLNFWGQEPTLTLDSFRKNLQDWFQAFPNINRTFFSTNGGTDPHIIFNYIKDIDTKVDRYIQIYIQYSYDGEWSCINERGIDPNLIKRHLCELIELLNETHLKNTHVFLCAHGVLGFDLIYELLNTNGIDDYLIDFDQFIINATSLIQNPKCHLAPVAINLQQPYPASVDDGLALADFLRKCLSTEQKYHFEFGNPIRHFFQTVTGRLNHQQKLFDEQGSWSQLIVDAINANENDHSALAAATCGAYRSELKCMYDGTLLGCQNFIHDLNKEHITDESILVRTVKENCIDHKMFINFNDPNLTIENVDDVFSKFDEFHNFSFITYYHSIVNSMIMLADAGQISPDYLTNKEKLFRHALMVSRYNICFYSRLITTGSMFIEPTYLCRLLCNGTLDVAEMHYEYEGEKYYKNKEIIHHDEI